MDAAAPEARQVQPAPRPPGRRLLVAIIAGLVAVVVILSGLVFDLGRARLEQDAVLAENRRLINALTKQLYWAEEQLDALRGELAQGDSPLDESALDESALDESTLDESTER